MFHPVGFQPPSVYWRRRLFLVGGIIAILILAALTIRAATGGGGTDAAGGAPASGGSTSKLVSSPPKHNHTSHGGAGTGASPTEGSSTAPSGTAPAGTQETGSTGATGSDAAPAPCNLSDLEVAAKVGSPTYSVGDSLVVELQVTNAGTAPCVQDLADKQIELRVYNGSSRVWGSHDCAIQPGVDDRTLAVGQPYVSSIEWGGLSSQKGCVGQRERVGAGKYTLYALLAGKKGTATTFTIS